MEATFFFFVSFIHYFRWSLYNPSAFCKEIVCFTIKYYICVLFSKSAQMLRATNEDGKCALGTDVAVMGHCTRPIVITAVLPSASPLGGGEDF